MQRNSPLKKRKKWTLEGTKGSNDSRNWHFVDVSSVWIFLLSPKFVYEGRIASGFLSGIVSLYEKQVNARTDFKNLLMRRLMSLEEEQKNRRQLGQTQKKLGNCERTFTQWKKQSIVLLEELQKYFPRNLNKMNDKSSFYENMRKEVLKIHELVSGSNFASEESELMSKMSEMNQVDQALQHSLNTMVVDVSATRVSAACLLTNSEETLETSSPNGISEEIKASRSLMSQYDEGIIPSGLPNSE